MNSKILKERVKSGVSRPVYVVDTNILYTFLEGQAQFGHSKISKSLRSDQETIRRLFKTEKVVIPQAVMVEIMGLYFHIRIDLDDYHMWYRKRKTVFNNLIIHFIFSELHQVSIHTENPGMMAMEISRSKISDNCIKKLRQKNKFIPGKDRGNRKGRNPKLLDGVDALIIATGVQVAAANRNRQCVILSNDKALAIAVENLKQGNISHYDIPKNIEFKTIHVI